jgi:hypothetical protein
LKANEQNNQILVFVVMAEKSSHSQPHQHQQQQQNDPLETAKWTRYLPEKFGIREAVRQSSYRWCVREGCVSCVVVMLWWDTIVISSIMVMVQDSSTNNYNRSLILYIVPLLVFVFLSSFS